MKLKCPKCKRGEVRQIVSVEVNAPAGCRQLNKIGLRSKDVSITAVLWDKALMYCPRNNCGWLMRQT